MQTLLQKPKRTPVVSFSDQLERINEFRKSAPVRVEPLAHALGVPVKYAFLPTEVSGMLERVNDDDVYQITVNAGDPLTRKRFTIAHELGHFMLHRYLLGDGIDEDRAYRSIAGGKYKNTKIGPREETEANKFAANLLMPYELVEKLKKEDGLTTAKELAQRLEVSVHAMSIRMGVPYPPTNPMAF